MRGIETDGLKLTVLPKEITSYISPSPITIYKYKQKVNKMEEIESTVFFRHRIRDPVLSV